MISEGPSEGRKHYEKLPCWPRRRNRLGNAKQSELAGPSPGAGLARPHTPRAFRSSPARELHGLLRPFLLRRVKAEVASELPRKTEVALYHGLSALQKRCYKAILMKDLGNQRPPVRGSLLATAARGGSVRSRSLCVAGAGDAVCVLKIVQSAAVDLAKSVTATSPAVALGTFPPLPHPVFLVACS